MAGLKDKKSSRSAKRELKDASAAPSATHGRPAKKAKLLDNTDDEDSDSDANQGGISLKVNEDYARRFEYNKKREEQHRRTPLII
jgi:protein KRI1